MKMKKIGTYNCKGGTDWKDGDYEIDFENSHNRKFAIWHNRQWACSNISSVKQAIRILKGKFTSVKQIQE